MPETLESNPTGADDAALDAAQVEHEDPSPETEHPGEAGEGGQGEQVQQEEKPGEGEQANDAGAEARELLNMLRGDRAQRQQGNGQQHQPDKALEEIRKTLENDYGADSDVVKKGFAPLLEKISKLEQQLSGMHESAADAQERAFVDSVAGKVGSDIVDLIGSGHNRTPEQEEKYQDVRHTALVLRDMAKRSGRTMTDQDAVRQAVKIVKSARPEADQVRENNDRLQRRHKARVPVSGRAPQAPKKNDDGLDPNDPDYEARKFAKNFKPVA